MAKTAKTKIKNQKLTGIWKPQRPVGAVQRTQPNHLRPSPNKQRQAKRVCKGPTRAAWVWRRWGGTKMGRHMTAKTPLLCCVLCGKRKKSGKRKSKRSRPFHRTGSACTAAGQAKSRDSAFRRPNGTGQHKVRTKVAPQRVPALGSTHTTKNVATCLLRSCGPAWRRLAH